MTEHAHGEKTLFGFWVYLLSDLMMFGVLFATLFVLKGASTIEVNASGALFRTVVFLAIPLFAPLLEYSLVKKKMLLCGIALAGILILGSYFFYDQMREFSSLVALGKSWSYNGLYSAFYTISGTFLVHLFFALLWTLFLAGLIVAEKVSLRVLVRTKAVILFWQFLTVVSVAIFVGVYLMGSCSS